MVKVEEVIQGPGGEEYLFFLLVLAPGLRRAQWALVPQSALQLCRLLSGLPWRQQSEDYLISKVPVKPQRWGEFQKENKTLICQDGFSGCHSEQKAAECLWPATWMWACETFPPPRVRNRTCLDENGLGRPQLVNVHFVFKTSLKENSCFLNQFYSEGLRKFLQCWGVASSVVSYVKLSSGLFRNMILLL